MIFMIGFNERQFMSMIIILMMEMRKDGSPIIPNTLEKIERLSQPILRWIFSKHHVIAAAGRNENDGSHIIEALDPLASLVPLTPDIKHAAVVIMVVIREIKRDRIPKKSLDRRYFRPNRRQLNCALKIE